jgi:hypothetical protein
MAITSRCPQCQRAVRVPEDLLGRLVKCPACGAQFTAAASEEPAPAPPPPPAFDEPVPPRAPGAAAEEFARREDEPLRRRGQAHRGGLILTLGIISIVGSAFGLPTPCCGPCTWPLAFPGIIGLALGIVAWVMGQGDLQKMDQGIMDTSGRGQTQNGKVCGIVGTSIGGFALACGIGWTILRLVFHIGGSAASAFGK